MDTSRNERFRRAQRAFDAFAECVHGSFSLYCKHCRDSHNILESRTRMGKFRDSVIELDRIGLLDGMKVYRSRYQTSKILTTDELVKAEGRFIGSLLVCETPDKGVPRVILRFFLKEKGVS